MECVTPRLLPLQYLKLLIKHKIFLSNPKYTQLTTTKEISSTFLRYYIVTIATIALLSVLCFLLSFHHILNILSNGKFHLWHLYMSVHMVFLVLTIHIAYIFHLHNYIDYEAYGRDIHLEGSGTFCSYGYVIRN